MPLRHPAQDGTLEDLGLIPGKQKKYLKFTDLLKASQSEN